MSTKKIALWALEKERSLAARTLASHFLGVALERGDSHITTLAEFNECQQLLFVGRGLRDRLFEMAVYSKEWLALAAVWDDISVAPLADRQGMIDDALRIAKTLEMPVKFELMHKAGGLRSGGDSSGSVRHGVPNGDQEVAAFCGDYPKIIWSSQILRSGNVCPKCAKVVGEKLKSHYKGESA